LEHPHILGIHDFGEQEITPGEIMPYLVVPYVAGGTLAQRMREATGPLPVQECLRYLHQAALAIDYAHSKRILHRDIKPANMLLRDDWLLLTDFGLAKVLGGTVARAQTYAGSGTPEYMAPEQITGRAQPASDRYSLAVVAYQLFTGRTPFRGSTPTETISQQLQAPLPPARQLNPQIPQAVENLLTIALSRNPDLRPPSCIALIDALQAAWTTGEQIESDPETTLLAPWGKRWQEIASSHPSWPAIPARSPQSTPILPLSPDVLPTPVRGAQTLTDPNQTSGPPANPDPFATNVGPEGGVTSTAPAPPFQYNPGFLERKVGRRSILIGSAVAAAVVIGGGAATLEILQTHSGSNQQNKLATPTPVPGPRKLIAGEPVLHLTGHSASVWTASWHPSGRYLMTASEDAFIMLWDLGSALQNSIPGPALATPQRKWTVAGIKFQFITDAVGWSKDGTKLIAGNSFGDKVYVLDAFGTASTPTIYRDMSRTVLNDTVIYGNVAAGPLPDQFTVLNSPSSGSQLQVWRFGRTDLPVASYEVAEELDTFRWSSDGSMLAAMTGPLAKQNGFYLWKSTDPFRPRLFTRPQRDKFTTFAIIANTLAWSPVDPHLLLVSNADEALIWDVRKDQPSLVLSAQVDISIPEISKLSWSPNGRYVVGSYDPPGDNATIPLNPKLFVWDVQSLLKKGPSSVAQPPSLTFSAPAGSPTHTQALIDISWSPDGRYLATTSFDRTVIIWRVDSQ
jgi:serine/threonine protein kinase/WD40 repeat protein